MPPNDLPPGFAMDRPGVGHDAPPPGFQLDATPMSAPPAAVSKTLDVLSTPAKDVAEDFNSSADLAAEGVTGLAKAPFFSGEGMTALGKTGMGVLGMTGAPASGISRAVVGDPLREHVPGPAGHALGNVAEALTTVVAPETAGRLVGAAGRALAGAAKASAKAAVKASGPTFAQALTAREAGYVLPPAEASANPSKISQLLGGWGGKIKTRQDASVHNQTITNGLAAQSLGLKPNMVITDKVLKDVRKQAGDAYKEVVAAVPEISLTPEERAQLAHIGGADSHAAQEFPNLLNHPDIIKFRDGLVSDFANGAKSTDAAIDAVRQLRHDSVVNMKALGDPGKHALGLALRDAAEVIDGIIDRNVSNAHDYFGQKFAQTMAAQTDAAKVIAEATGRLSQARTMLAADPAATGTFNVSGRPQMLSAAQAERDAIGDIDHAQTQLNQAQKDSVQWRTKLTDAKASEANNRTLVGQYRKARQLIAKTHDVEAVTNTATGDVNAMGLAKLQDKGRPLMGELKTIADAANSFPHSMQKVSSVGGAEAHSALDMFGAGTALMHGNPSLAAGVMGRPAGRATMLSRPYQDAMMGRTPPAQSIPVITPPRTPVLSRLLGVGAAASQYGGAPLSQFVPDGSGPQQ